MAKPMIEEESILVRDAAGKEAWRAPGLLLDGDVVLGSTIDDSSDLDAAQIKPLGSTEDDEGLAKYATDIPRAFETASGGPRVAADDEARPLPGSTPLDFRGSGEKPEPLAFVARELLEKAKLFQERHALYGDNYHRFGLVMSILLEGQTLDVSDHKLMARYGVFTQIIGKITRYAENFTRGGHDDSLDDPAVYCMMLKELDHEYKYPEASLKKG